MSNYTGISYVPTQGQYQWTENILKGTAIKGTGKFWEISTVEANGLSNKITSTSPQTTLSIFGITTASTTLILMMSMDGETFFKSQYYVEANGHFGYCIPCPFNSIMLFSSAAATISAYAVWA